MSDRASSEGEGSGSVVGRRLLIVVNNPAFFMSHRLPLAVAARDAGMDVLIATPHGEAVAQIRSAGFAWHEVVLSRSGMHPLQEVKSLLALTRLYRRLRPDVVHHVTIKPVLYGTLAARLAHVSIVVNAISGMGFLFTSSRRLKRMVGRALYRALMRHPCMGVIIQNQEDRDFFISQKLAELDQIELIRGSGVDTEQFTPFTKRLDPNPVVLQASRMLADKGVREFISAARELRPLFPEARFVLVGAVDHGNPSSLTEAELGAAEEEGAIEWWGHQSDMPKVLEAATVFCLPSYREGLPKSLIEAAACGLPIITTDTSGCREVVQHEINGLLVPVADSRALAAAIKGLLESPETALEYGEAARRKAEENFALQKIVSQQIELYRKLLEKGGSGRAQVKRVYRA